MARSRTKAQRVQAQAQKWGRENARDNRRKEWVGRATQHRMQQASVMERRATATLRLADNDPNAHRSAPIPEVYNLAGRDLVEIQQPQVGEIFGSMNPRGSARITSDYNYRYDADQLARPFAIGGTDSRLTPHLLQQPMALPRPGVTSPRPARPAGVERAPAVSYGFGQGLPSRPGSNQQLPAMSETGTTFDGTGTFGTDSWVGGPLTYTDEKSKVGHYSGSTPFSTIRSQRSQPTTPYKLAGTPFHNRLTGTRNAAACWTGDRPCTPILAPIMCTPQQWKLPSSQSCPPILPQKPTTPGYYGAPQLARQDSNDPARTCSPAWVRLHTKQRSGTPLWTVPRDMIPPQARMDRPTSKGAPVPHMVIPGRSQISGTYRSAVQPLGRIE